MAIAWKRYSAALRKVSFDLIAPAVISLIAAWICYFLKLPAFHNLFITVATLFFCYAVVLYAEFLAFRNELRAAIEDQALANRQTTLLAHYAEALRSAHSLPRLILLRQFGEYEELLREASKGRITVISPHRTLMNYAEFFKSAQDEASIKATALIVPADAYRQLILKENDAFIKRRGKVGRIFLVPHDKQKADAYQQFMNEQRRIGVTVKFVLTDSIPDELKKDILVLDKPRMATEARPTSGLAQYESVQLIYDPHQIEKVERAWDELDQLALVCDQDDSLLKVM